MHLVSKIVLENVLVIWKNKHGKLDIKQNILIHWCNVMGKYPYFLGIVLQVHLKLKPKNISM